MRYKALRFQLVVFVVLLCASIIACDRLREFDFERGAKVTGGNPEMGRRQLGRHSCTSCHIIPGVPKADGNRGPSLEHWASRRNFLDTLPNTPGNLEKWLRTPSHVKPGTRMPDLDVTADDSRDMTAYLFSIN